MGDKTTHDEKAHTMANGLVRVHMLRDNIAKFLAANDANTLDDFINTCNLNDWEPDVVYDFRAAMFQLGCVLATLTLWDKEVLPENPEPVLAIVNKLEADYARKSRQD